ncbi:hypothetical protein [Rosenbergiella epipactidis]|uniref:hypothetical protein n=1 Tax=Rosenbergiella epipactidis TaxID=1544694 RepID=UPI001F4DCE14|nr:hypothetical protein [Rosenbergiella epipactidis]
MRKATLIVIIIIILGAIGYRLHSRSTDSHQLAQQQALAQFAALPGYRLLKQQEPQLWHEVRESFLHSLAAGHSQQQAIGEVRGQLTELVNLRIVKADDRAVTNYITVAVQEMQALNTVSAESCYRFLYPQVSGGVNIGTLLSSQMNQADQQALEQLFLHSLGSDRTRDIKAAHNALNEVVKRLYPHWGNQLQQLNQPEDLATDHQKLCVMSIDLYRTILKLPQPEAANLIRQMVVG